MASTDMMTMTKAQLAALIKKEVADSHKELIKQLTTVIKAEMATIATSEGVSTTKKEVKKRGPRGSSGWDLFKKQVRQEMTEAEPERKFKLEEVAAECKRRKELGEYDEAHWKSLAAEKKTSSVHESESETESASSESKKRGRPKGSKNKPKEAVAPIPEEEEEESVASKWTHGGKTYFKTTDNQVWQCIDDNVGDLVGRFNPLTNKIVKS